VTDVKTGKITASDLKTEDAFIVDIGSSVFVWSDPFSFYPLSSAILPSPSHRFPFFFRVGAKTSKKERLFGLSSAGEYLTKEKRKGISVVQIFEGQETKAFTDALDS
jgi:hypothetical protein